MTENKRQIFIDMKDSLQRQIFSDMKTSLQKIDEVWGGEVKTGIMELLDTVYKKYKTLLYDKVKDLWEGIESEYKGNMLLKKAIAGGEWEMSYWLDWIEDEPWYGIIGEEKEWLRKILDDEKNPLKKYHGLYENGGYYLNIFKFTDMPDNVDRVALKVVEGLKYLEDECGRKKMK